MSSTRSEQVKHRICEELAARRLSISHDRWHLERVLGFAEQLQAIYGGDLEVITVAALLHDLGRTEPNLHGRASVKKSVEEAEQILSVVELPGSKIEAILVAIKEHDQADLRPSTLEGRILKDADFLAGFGAWGILRIAMWAAETDRGVPQIFDRLENRMPKRLESLEFPESVRLATREMLFADLFLSRLREPPRVDDCRTLGKYVILEGISGSGKDTQAELLRPRLEELGHTVMKVTEPGGKYKCARDHWRQRANDPVVQMFLLLADRYDLICDRVEPALVRGDTVLSVRSFLSTLVYQHQGLYESAAIAFMHHFVPPPDLVILYDLDVDIAYKRCADRVKGQVDQMGAHETKEVLTAHRVLYLQVVRQMKTLESVIIDASGSEDSIAQITWLEIERRIL